MESHVILGKCVFEIKKDNQFRALRLIQDYAKDAPKMHQDMKQLIMSGKSIAGVLGQVGYECSIDEDGNIYEVHMKDDEYLLMDGELIKDEELFIALAPTVENGSYITCVPHKGAPWRWYFQNSQLVKQKCYNVWAAVTVSLPSLSREEVEVISIVLKQKIDAVKAQSERVDSSWVEKDFCEMINTTEEEMCEAMRNDLASFSKHLAQICEKLTPAIDGAADAIAVVAPPNRR